MSFWQTVFSSEWGLLVLLVPPFLLSLYAQASVKSTFAKYSKVNNARGLTGAQTAKILMQLNDISDVSIQPIGGALTDHYAPGQKVLRLSEPVYDQRSISAVGVAAHETGHAIQHHVHYGPLVLRSTLVPIANIGSSAGPYLVILGLALTISWLTKLGIALFAGAVVFYLITLPVEVNASRRALANLQQHSVLTDEELKGARKVLKAAAMTYLASALTAIVSLLRLILIARRRNSER